MYSSIFSKLAEKETAAFKQDDARAGREPPSFPSFGSSTSGGSAGGAIFGFFLLFSFSWCILGHCAVVLPVLGWCDIAQGESTHSGFRPEVCTQHAFLTLTPWSTLVNPDPPQLPRRCMRSTPSGPTSPATRTSHGPTSTTPQQPKTDRWGLPDIAQRSWCVDKPAERPACIRAYSRDKTCLSLRPHLHQLGLSARSMAYPAVNLVPTFRLQPPFTQPVLMPLTHPSSGQGPVMTVRPLRRLPILIIIVTITIITSSLHRYQIIAMTALLGSSTPNTPCRSAAGWRRRTRRSGRRPRGSMWTRCGSWLLSSGRGTRGSRSSR